MNPVPNPLTRAMGERLASSGSIVFLSLLATLLIGGGLSYGQSQGGGYGNADLREEPEQQSELPMTFAGEGCRLVIRTLDLETLRVTGTVEVGGPAMRWSGYFPIQNPEAGMSLRVQTPEGAQTMMVSTKARPLPVQGSGGRPTE